MKYNMKTTAIVLAFGAAFASAASAQTPPAGGAIKLGQACKADITKLCSTAAKGADRARCLRDNQAKVSPDCAKAIAAKPATWGVRPAAPAAAAAPTATPAPAATPVPAPAPAPAP